MLIYLKTKCNCKHTLSSNRKRALIYIFCVQLTQQLYEDKFNQSTLSCCDLLIYSGPKLVPVALPPRTCGARAPAVQNHHKLGWEQEIPCATVYVGSRGPRGCSIWEKLQNHFLCAPVIHLFFSFFLTHQHLGPVSAQTDMTGKE